MRASLSRDPVDLVLLARILGVLLVLHVALPILKVRETVRWLTPSQLPPTRDLVDVQRIVRHVDGLLRRAPHLSYGPCLLRSLTLYYFCTRLGYPVRINFGVREEPDGRFDAHGWLGLDDHAFMEPGGAEEIYTLIWQLPLLEVDRPSDQVQAAPPIERQEPA